MSFKLLLTSGYLVSADWVIFIQISTWQASRSKQQMSIFAEATERPFREKDIALSKIKVFISFHMHKKPQKRRYSLKQSSISCLNNLSLTFSQVNLIFQHAWDSCRKLCSTLKLSLRIPTNRLQWWRGMNFSSLVYLHLESMSQAKWCRVGEFYLTYYSANHHKPQSIKIPLVRKVSHLVCFQFPQWMISIIDFLITKSKNQ